MLLHCSLHWPAEFSPDLWPFAVDYACWVYNHTPGDCGFSPIELLSGTRVPCILLDRLRVWGCPAYVLDPRLQDGHKIPKWEPRSRQGQFLGFSDLHSSTIGLVRNLRTGFISPQYHIVYDEMFSTVTSPAPIPSSISFWEDLWEHLFRTSRDLYLDADDYHDPQSIPLLDSSWLSDAELQQRNRNIQPHPILPSGIAPSSPSTVPDNAEQGGISTPERSDIIDPSSPSEPVDYIDRLTGTNVPSSPLRDITNTTETGRVPSNTIETGRAPTLTIEPGHVPNSESGRETRHRVTWNDPLQTNIPPTKRDRKPNPRFIGPDWVNNVSLFQSYTPLLSKEAQFMMNLDWSDIDQPVEPQYNTILMTTDSINQELISQNPMAFQAKLKTADSPSLRDILRMTDLDEQNKWFEAMDSEIQALLKKGTFKPVLRSVATSQNKEIVGTTWVFKRKRKPDGTIIKYKARLVVRGDQQTQVGNTVDETYAPVVSWSTIRLMLTLSVTHKMVTTQIDFRNAFVQSSLPSPIYVELPGGGYSNNPKYFGHILEVYKSLYGDVRAPKLWYNHLRAALEKEGFVVDPLDACLFTKHGCIFVVYVDDAILMAKDQRTIDEVLQNLEHQGLDIERMGTLTDYLGVHLSKDSTNGDLILSQPDLTKRLIEVLGLSNAKSVSTPATGPLYRSLDHEPMSDNFNYRSAVGMAMYLANNTRIDCAMATHQCARFCANPRQPHEVALKRIGRYLVGNQNQGLHIKPRGNLKLDCYVDADFCGLFNLDDCEDPSSYRSRSGYLLTLGDVPILWSSKMQTCIALSTMEAEYIALSSAMRALIPLKGILQSFATTLDLHINCSSTMSTVWEDNQAALILGTTNPPRMTPRSKHIGIQYHWFRSHLKPGYIEIHHIPSSSQKADILTKALERQKHEHARHLCMGW